MAGGSGFISSPAVRVELFIQAIDVPVLVTCHCRYETTSLASLIIEK